MPAEYETSCIRAFGVRTRARKSCAAQIAIEKAKVGDMLSLQREDNKFDSNAVLVLNADPWMEDVMQVLSEIKDPAMRKLAIDQLKCIARIS